MMSFRFVQAFGGCAIPVIAQAMARDYFGREGSARALSIMMLVMALAPALAPLIGAKVLAIAGWKAIFYVLAGYGMAALTLVNSRVVLKQGHDRMLTIGVFSCVAITLMFAVQQYRFEYGIAPVIVLLFCFMAVRGLVGANAVAGAMADHPERAGAASALTGCLQFGAGYVSGLALNWLHDGTPRAMATIMAGFCVLALIVLKGFAPGAFAREP